MSAAAELLPEMLGRLKLGAVRDRLDSLLDEAARHQHIVVAVRRLAAGCAVSVR